MDNKIRVGKIFMITEKRKIRYSLPKKILYFEGDIQNLDSLLGEKDDQINVSEDDTFSIKGKGFIVLDFGKELCGGIRILTHFVKVPEELYKVRIRFGESVSEAFSEIGEKSSTNNHALRDLEISLPALSDQSFGDTGFRFVRIDFLDENTTCSIKQIYAKEFYRKLPVKQTFKSEDKLVNQIYKTCVRTLDLNIQNRIWDGIKRDRLVWIGDMEIEIKSILYLHGLIPDIEQSLFTAEQSNKLPGWMNGIPSYSTWYLLILNDIYNYSKDRDFIFRHLEYANKVIEQISHAFNDKGEFGYEYVKECPSDFYFFDWPSSEEPLEDKKGACLNLLKYVLSKVKSMFEELKIETSTLDMILSKINKNIGVLPKNKAFLAFYHLINKDEESYKLLIKDLPRGMSTFMSYYVLKAVAENDKDLALKIMKEYYGAMLQKGATSFWEDFNIDWVKNSSRIDKLPSKGQLDIHGDFGAYCYKGFRHSLCHGWSVGPIAILFEYFK